MGRSCPRAGRKPEACLDPYSISPVLQRQPRPPSQRGHLLRKVLKNGLFSPGSVVWSCLFSVEDGAQERVCLWVRAHVCFGGMVVEKPLRDSG